MREKIARGRITARLANVSRCLIGIEAGMATHFLTKTLPKVAAEMALSVLAYNLTRVMNIVGTKPLMAAIAA